MQNEEKGFIVSMILAEVKTSKHKSLYKAILPLEINVDQIGKWFSEDVLKSVHKKKKKKKKKLPGSPLGIRDPLHLSVVFLPNNKVLKLVIHCLLIKYYVSSYQWKSNGVIK